MKTNTFITSIFTFCVVIFAAASGISNPVMNNTGDITKKTENKSVSSVKNEADAANEYRYLRFDLNDYSNENKEIELPVITFDYLRFDVNKYVESNRSEMLEMPAANDLEYLKFDVNNFATGNINSLDDLPLNEFDYLRFDVTNFSASGNNSISELPVTE